MNASSLASSIAIAALLVPGGRPRCAPSPRRRQTDARRRLAGCVVCHAPAHGRPWPVAAERAGADRSLEMVAELGVAGGNGLHGVTDACRYRFAGPLGGIAQRAGAPAEAERRGQFVRERVALVLDSADAAEVIGGFGVGQIG